MKKFLSLIMALAMLIAPVGAISSFADGLQSNMHGATASRFFSRLSAKMERNQVEEVVMSVKIRDGDVDLSLSSYDSAGHCVDTSESIINKYDFITIKLRMILRLMKMIVDGYSFDEFSFDVVYFCGEEDYKFANLQIQLEGGQVLGDDELRQITNVWSGHFTR